MLKHYLIIATRLKIFLMLIFRNGISLHPAYLLRFMFLLQSSIWSSILAFREQVTYGPAIKKTTVPRDPLFIIGHWRTGSTFLHQLMACDPQFAVPTLLQCTYPESYMASRQWIAPVMNMFLSGKRPMDNVRMLTDDPQEDEYALFRITGISPLEQLIFPHSKNFFLADIRSYMPPQDRQTQWEKAMIDFTQKLFLHTGRRIVFKNPFHSLRIPLLNKLFPEARFIHIHRDPLDVIPSTIHMWTVVGGDNALRKEWRPPQFEEVVDHYIFFMDRLASQLQTLSQDQYIACAFEDLEQNPVHEIKKIYSHFGIAGSEEADVRTQRFLSENTPFRKNSYQLTPDQKSRLQTLSERYGYAPEKMDNN